MSSGAIAEGMQRLGWARRPSAVHELQAAAAVGQMGLAQMYETKLREHGLASAQVLLTHADLADRERYLNARSTLLTLFVVPVFYSLFDDVQEWFKRRGRATANAEFGNRFALDAAGRTDAASQFGAAAGNQFSLSRAAISEPRPTKDGASCTTTARRVRRTDSTTVGRSSGDSDRRSTTSRLRPSSSAAVAAS